MNVQAKLLTITPEQLKDFERVKDSIAFDVQSTSDILDQMSTLFYLISKISKEESPSIHQIRNLSILGQYTCEGWSGVIESIEERIKELSPLETVKA